MIAQQGVLFQDLFQKAVEARFSGEKLSTDGGSILLKAADRRMGMIEALNATLSDSRMSGKVEHSLRTLMAQRIYSIALGYPDGNDAARLKDDGMLKLLCDRDPGSTDTLGSQPTLSRFENAMRARALLRFGHAYARTVLRYQQQGRCGARRPKRILIDLDPTCDPTHGQQQLTLFNGHYDTWCYLPVVVTVSFDGEPRKYPLAALLRPGTASAMVGVPGLLRRTVRAIREFFPHTRLYFRADAAYAVPGLLDWLEAEGIRYAISMSSNSKLKDMVQPALTRVRAAVESSGQTKREYGVRAYQAGSWKRFRLVSYKAEVLAEMGAIKDNARFLVHRLPGNVGSQGAFAFYYGHSDMENTLKSLKEDLAMDRTSCCSFLANQFRILMTLAAYALMMTVSEHAANEELRRATMGSLRIRLLKIAVRIKSSVRRVLLEFTGHFPWAEDWMACALAIGAVPKG